MIFDTRHGAPYERGASDAYYGKNYSPHCWKLGTHVVEKDMTAEEIQAYRAGYYGCTSNLN